MSTLLEFRARFPQLGSVPDPIVVTALTDAMGQWDPSVPNWGAIICYQAAHSITIQSIAMAEEAELVRSGSKQSGSQRKIGYENLSDTQYGRELCRMTASWVGGGFGLV